MVEDESNEEMLQSVYQLLNESEYTDDFKAVLNEEQADYIRTKRRSMKKT